MSNLESGNLQKIIRRRRRPDKKRHYRTSTIFESHQHFIGWRYIAEDFSFSLKKELVATKRLLAAFMSLSQAKKGPFWRQKTIKTTSPFSRLERRQFTQQMKAWESRPLAASLLRRLSGKISRPTANERAESRWKGGFAVGTKRATTTEGEKE